MPVLEVLLPRDAANHIESSLKNILFEDSRQEERPSVCIRAVLPEHPVNRAINLVSNMKLLVIFLHLPQVVTADQALKARPQKRVAIVLTVFHSLVHGAVTITEIGTLRSTEVEIEAFKGA